MRHCIDSPSHSRVTRAGATALTLLVCVAVATAAPPTAPVDPVARQVLDQIATGDASTREAAIAQLDKLAPRTIEGLGSFLSRKRQADLTQRRGVLAMIGAEVPDEKGRFPTPPRRSAKDQKAADNLDWLALLMAIEPAGEATLGLGEVIADDAAIRALAKTKTIRAAEILFDLAFGEETMIYRDEIGRYLRTMEPHCIPALMVGSQARNYDRKRYASYQLERLDRQDPNKALRATADDEALTITLLDSFRTTRHREAVHAVWSKINADSPRIRRAARAAWMAYITGPAPRPAPKKKLQLPGGKLTKKEKPLWLTYRELADNELRKAANEYLNEDLPPLADPQLDDNEDVRVRTVKVDLLDLTKRLWAFFDNARATQEAVQWTAANAQAQAGDLAGAAAQIDRMLALNPERDGKPQMATIYFQLAKQHEQRKDWPAAEAAYSKALGLDPTGPNATDALAGHHYALGKALEAKGKDGGPDFRRAVALRPDYAPAKAAAERVDRPDRPTWILWSAGLALAASLGLFVAGMVKRRA